MKKYLIIGGCISLDYFRYAKKFRNETNVDYIIRVPFISLTGKKIEYSEIIENPEKIKNEDDFKAIVNLYRGKEIYNEKIENANVIITDLYKDSYDLVEYEDSYYVVPPQFETYGIEYKKNKVRIVEKEEQLLLFSKSVEEFIKNYSKKKIIYININFHYKLEDKKIIDEDIYKKYENKLREMNEIMQQYKNQIEVVNAGTGEFKLDLNHEWGISPVHFKAESWIQNS